jgi:transcriptional regulator with XRE-family HTH domain
MSTRLPVRHRTFLQKHRQEASLTATDLAALCNVSGGYIGRLEEGLKQPSLMLAFILQLIFDVPADALFPDLHAAAATALAEHAGRFSIAIEKVEGGSADRKRALLAGILHRVAEATPEA